MVNSSWASSEGVRASMRSNRRSGTRPEMRVRRLAHAAGLRYRVDAPPLADHRLRADLVFSRAKVAVFIDGCFWHGCPKHYRAAKRNEQFWRDKIAANQCRDHRADELLTAEGWEVVRVWEHDDPQAVVTRLIAIVRARAPIVSKR